MNAERLDRLSTLLFVIVLYSGQACADAWQQTVSAKVLAEYDTNPTMTPAYTEAVLRTLLEPSYTLMRTFEKNDVKTGVAIQAERSSNETVSPARNSPSGFLEWLHYMEAGEFGIASKYSEVATRDAGISATGVDHLASTRTSRTLSGRLRNMLNEHSTLLADGSYENVSFKGGPYIDYATRSANVTFSNIWSERSTLFVKASYADYDPVSEDSFSRFSSGIFGMNWKFSDSLESTLHAGKYRISGSDKLGTLAGAELQFTGEKILLSMNASHQVLLSGLGGLGGPAGFVAVDQANINWRYALSERNRTGIDLVWQKLFFATPILDRYAGVWLEYDLNSYWVMRTYYRHHMRDMNGIDGASANIVGFSLVYTDADF